METVKHHLAHITSKSRQWKVGLVLLLILVVVYRTFLGGDLFADSFFHESGNREEETQPSITILLPQHMLPRESFAFLDRYRRQYEEETGVKVNLERIMAANRQRFLLKRNTRLYLSNGPTLILISHDEYARELVEAGVAQKVAGKVSNQQSLYDGLVDDYFVPVKMHGKTVSINRVFLEKHGLPEPALTWTLDEYGALWDLWSEREEVFFNRNLFHAIVERKMRGITLIDEANNKVNLNTGEVRKLIEEIRQEVYSGKYILEKDYTFENYYNMFHVMNSEESQDSWEKFIRNSRHNFIMNTVGHHYNGLHSQRSNQVVKYIPTSLLLPDVRQEPYHFIGFLVNRNGENTSLGLDFIDYLLSDEIQLDLFEQEAEMENSTNAPVIKTIEYEIEAFELRRDILKEAITLRKAMTERLKHEDLQALFYGPDLKELRVRQRLITELINIIFADEPYTEEVLSHRLGRMEDELTLYLNE